MLRPHEWHALGIKLMNYEVHFLSGQGFVYRQQSLLGCVNA